MKKGISPLIGWVLIIGFSVSAGLLITTWAIDQFKDIDLPETGKHIAIRLIFD